MSQKADWVSWALHALGGAVMGWLIALPVSRLKGVLGYPGRLGPPFLSEENRMIFIAGGALIGAGIASLYGQRTWSGFRSATHILPIEAPVHSRASRAVSIGGVVLGVVAILCAVYREIIARA